MDPSLAVFAAAAMLLVALATLFLGLFAWLCADMRRIESQTGRRFNRVDERLDRMDERFDRLEARMAAMEHGQAKLEGLLEGLREAIAGRARQAAE